MYLVIIIMVKNAKCCLTKANAIAVVALISQSLLVIQLKARYPIKLMSITKIAPLP